MASGKGKVKNCESVMRDLGYSGKDPKQISYHGRRMIAGALFGESPKPPALESTTVRRHRFASNMHCEVELTHPTPGSIIERLEDVQQFRETLASEPVIPEEFIVILEKNPIAPDAFHRLIDYGFNASVVYLDLEHSQKGYEAYAALAQLHFGTGPMFLLDPIHMFSTVKLVLKRLSENGAVFVLFAGERDLQLMARNFDVYPRAYIDLQKVFMKHVELAQLPGLELAVDEVLSFKLSTDCPKPILQVADWTLRPLPQELQDYAAADVKYLAKMLWKMVQEEPHLLPVALTDGAKELRKPVNKIQNHADLDSQLRDLVKEAPEPHLLDLSRVQALLQYRINMARILDCSVREVLQHKVIWQLATKKNWNKEEVAALLEENKKGRFKEQIRTIMRCIDVGSQEGRMSMSMQCHRCALWGHTAWHCWLPYNFPSHLATPEVNTLKVATRKDLVQKRMRKCRESQHRIKHICQRTWTPFGFRAYTVYTDETHKNVVRDVLYSIVEVKYFYKMPVYSDYVIRSDDEQHPNRVDRTYWGEGELCCQAAKDELIRRGSFDVSHTSIRFYEAGSRASAPPLGCLKRRREENREDGIREPFEADWDDE